MNQIVEDLANDAVLQHKTIQHISDCTGLDRKTVASILQKENDNPKIETLQAISKCLGGEIVYQTVDSNRAVKSGDISYYRTMIAKADHDMENKSRWIKYLFVTCLALIAVIVLTNVMAILVVSTL